MKKLIAVIITTALLFSLAACQEAETTPSGTNVKLDPKNPITISVWHYYNGAISNAFEASIAQFNETIGEEKGIIVESFGLGNVSELEKAVIAAVNKEVGSREVPNIFASYADTAYATEKLNMLANLDDYLTEEEKAEYIASYIEEGKIGLDGELRIFPVAKSTEIFMMNDTDWTPFAIETGYTYDDLETWEGIANVSKAYYEWIDAKTPDIPNDGKAFYGRDSMANFFIVGSKELGVEIFEVENGEATINVDETIMRKIWDTYYIPYINGYYMASGKFRSDDAKVGDLLAYVGSTASATYFPSEVTVETSVYPIEAKVLPVPHFENSDGVVVQQGAGMVVTKSTPEAEYASVEFLKWFTDVNKNIEFSALSGYMPVKMEANDYELVKSTLEDTDIILAPITDITLQTALESIKINTPYTNKAFDSGASARAILENSLHEKAVKDRADIVAKMADGMTKENALAGYLTEENFISWFETLKADLDNVNNR